MPLPREIAFADLTGEQKESIRPLINFQLERYGRSVRDATHPCGAHA